MNAGVLHPAKGRCQARHAADGARSHSGLLPASASVTQACRSRGGHAFSGLHQRSRSWSFSSGLLMYNRRRKATLSKANSRRRPR